MARRITCVVLLLLVSSLTPLSAQVGRLRQAVQNAKKDVATADTLLGNKPGQTAAQAAQDPRVWDNYDFVPGSKVLFFTDFTDDRTGNFSRRLRYKSGAMDVVERDGVKVLRATSRSEFVIPVGRKLPERFTLEIDVIAPPSRKIDMVSFEGGRDLDRGAQSANVTWNPTGLFILGSGQDMSNSPVKLPDAMQPGLINQVTHLRVLMDGAYFKMYVNERRVYNIPELAFRRDSLIRVLTTGAED
jgi:hypothetical protein